LGFQSGLKIVGGGSGGFNARLDLDLGRVLGCGKDSEEEGALRSVGEVPGGGADDAFANVAEVGVVGLEPESISTS